MLRLYAESSEGTHELIEVLEKTIENIKGGYQEHTEQNPTNLCDWKITPQQ